jgi:methyl-accepting chemotaxis protein
MDNWTISRRIIASLFTVALITLALGVFALWRVMGLSHDITYLADDALPSVLSLGEAGNLSRDNLISMLQIDPEGSAERNTQLEEKITANAARREELFTLYEGVISDEKERRLFEEAKRARETAAASRNRALELLKQNNLQESRKLQQEAVIPDYGALNADIDYNTKLAEAYAEDGKDAVRFSVRLIGISLGLALLLSALMAWRLIRWINRALGNITLNLDQGAIQTATAARQVAMASQTLASGASQQASSVEETSTSLEEISSMIRATAENAEKAKGLASDARTMAQTGSSTMSKMTDAMAAIDASSAEVAKIVKNIDEIAFQTNILALNAAVEAARAGGAGAGFAVVADEVRSLAQRSAAAAKETAEKIEVAIANSRKGSECTGRVEEALVQIADKVTSTDALAADIATAAHEQAQGIEQINTAVAQLDRVSQSNSSSAEESASAAEELDAQAAALKDQVAKLRQLVGGNSSASSTPAASPARLLPKMIPAITSSGRRAIPMPGNRLPTAEADDEGFRNF